MISKPGAEYVSDVTLDSNAAVWISQHRTKHVFVLTTWAWAFLIRAQKSIEARIEKAVRPEVAK